MAKAKAAAELLKANEKGAAKGGDKPAGETNTQTSGGAQPPRFEFGAADDFQLSQAMNHLKGQPVIASTKSLAAQAKP